MLPGAVPATTNARAGRGGKTNAGRGLQIVYIDSEESDDAVRAFRKKYAITTPIAMDEKGNFTYALEAGSSQRDLAVPVTLFIDPNGYLYCEREGGMSDTELSYRIKQFLTASAPSIVAPSPAASLSP